jgi:hypothetical protein
MPMLRRFSPVVPAALLLLAALVVDPQFSLACPYCEAGQITISEDIADVHVAAVVRLVDRPAEQPADAPLDASLSTFEVVDVLKGEEHLARRTGTTKPYRIRVLFFGPQPLGTRFLVLGIAEQADLQWGTPDELSEAAVDYVRQLPKLIRSATDRLTLCQKYFEHADPKLAADAYDEFARSPYSDLIAIRERMPREKLLGWIGDKKVPTHRRRLYLCMLSVCGKPEDLATLEKLIHTDDRHLRSTLDAQVGAYLALKGPAGMPLVEDLFLKNGDAEYTDTYAAIMAIRFIGTETKAVSRERLTEGLRHMLARPRLADLVISDLARWQDWSALPRLVELFKTADEQSVFVRVHVVNYLRACTLPEAKTHLEELAIIDPEAIKQAAFYIPQASVPPEGAQRRASE